MRLWALSVLLVLCFVLLACSVLVQVLVLDPMSVKTRNWQSSEFVQWDPPKELVDGLETALGVPTKVRTLAMIKEFLAWFNANKAGWGGVSDDQLETLIIAHVSDWPYLKQLQFKFLIDEYKELERIRKLREKAKRA